MPLNQFPPNQFPPNQFPPQQGNVVPGGAQAPETTCRTCNVARPLPAVPCRTPAMSRRWLQVVPKLPTIRPTPTDAMVNRLAEAERAVKDERRSHGFR